MGLLHGFSASFPSRSRCAAASAVHRSESIAIAPAASLTKTPLGSSIALVKSVAVQRD